MVFGEWRQLLLPTRLAGPVSAVLHKHDERDMLGMASLARALGVKPSKIFKAPKFEETVQAPVWNFGHAGKLASFMATLTSNLNSSDDQQELHTWITSLKGFEAQQAQAKPLATCHFEDAARLIRIIRLSVQLKDTRNIATALEAALDLAIGRFMPADWVQQVISAQHLKRFKAWTVRFIMDVAYMRVFRTLNASSMYVRYVQMDSSPQGGKDYLNIIMSHVLRSSLPRLLWIWYYFFEHPVDVEHSDEDLIETHKAYQAELRSALSFHRCPSVMLGHGRSSIAFKLAAAAHAFRLENHDALQTANFIKEICIYIS